MSTIGKIFVVLNLVLAAAFVGWAFHATETSGDWMKKYNTAVETAGKEKLGLDEELKKVRAELSLTKSDFLTATNARDEAKRAQERLTTEKAELESKNSNLAAAVTKIETTLGEINASADKAQADQVKALAGQKAAEEARRTAELAQQKAEESQAGAEAQLRDAQTQIASLEKEKTKLINQAGSLQTSLDTLAANTGASLNDFQNVEKIDGAVMGIDASIEPGLVMINAGSSKGVKRGYVFDVYSGSNYKGRVRVDFVHPDVSSGQIVYLAQNQQIAQGDSATTRL
jgi:uncharacterized protein (DUF3084 family)